jgi:hypothetical protein
VSFKFLRPWNQTGNIFLFLEATSLQTAKLEASPAGSEVPREIFPPLNLQLYGIKYMGQRAQDRVHLHLHTVESKEEVR